MGKEADLIKAGGGGDVPAILKSLKEGADVNCKDSEYGNTPLIIAAMYGKGAAVTTLVENGASLDLQNRFGSTALYLASNNNYPSIVKYLVGLGANLSIKTSFGETALDIATGDGNAEVVAILKNAEK
eukprot:gene27079-7333_t